MAVEANTPARRTHQRGVDTRRDILDAALLEFGRRRVDAASTRAIAARAGIRQGQLTYHFETKDVLWRSTVDRLFERFDEAFEPDVLAQVGALSPDKTDAALAAAVRSLVRAVSNLPELNRIMVHESTAASDRLTWMVDRHVRHRFEQLSELWQLVRAQGRTHLDADPLVIYYCVVGAASLLYVNAPEAQLLARKRTRRVVSDELVSAHADTLVAMLLGPIHKDTT